MEFNELNLAEMDKDLTAEERRMAGDICVLQKW